MKHFPLVSIIIPNYNYARYLRERMDSVLNQTFRDFEVIILDDASTDESLQIIEEYREHPLVTNIVLNKENSGSPFKQWQKGVAMAHGKYIWIAEADDVAELNFLERTVMLAEQYPDTSICHVGFKIIDSNSCVIKKDSNEWRKRCVKGYASFDGVDYAKHNLYWGTCIRNASGALFCREYAIGLIDSMFSTLRYAGDWVFWFEMSMQGRVIEVYEDLNYFRNHGISVTDLGKKEGKGLKEDILVVKYMEDRLKDISLYKRIIRNSFFYKRIKRMKANDSVKEELFCYLKEMLNVGKNEFLIERINKYLSSICPYALTKERDRL